MRMVKVVWRDAHSCLPEWTEGGRLPDAPYICVSVGFLIEHSKPDHIVVALNRSEDGHVSDGIAIPKAMVDSITDLTEPQTWKERVRSQLRAMRSSASRRPS